MWGGYSEPALALLKAQASSGGADERIDALRPLAVWHAYRGLHDIALENLEQMRSLGEDPAQSRTGVLILAECLRHLGRATEAARALESRANRPGPPDLDFCLSYANCLDADEARLAWINRVFGAGGFAPIAAADPSRPLTIDNLTAEAAVATGAAAGPKVSVIVPAFNAMANMEFAIRSLLSQTWTNIEVVAVDDASTDGTLEVLRALAASDPRIKLVRNERNQGSYSSRDAALPHITGDLITVQDCDDWSHPQKIEAQVRVLQSSHGLIGTWSHWARATRDLRFVGTWRPNDPIVVQNETSFMFTRDVLAALGGWDRVRIGADSEFIRRAVIIFGDRRIGALPGPVPTPLSFSLWQGDSLTLNRSTHIQTIPYGVRRTYREAAFWWYGRARTAADLRIDASDTSRKFPAPPRILPDRPEITCDVFFVADVNSPEAVIVQKWIVDAPRDCRIALFHWPGFASDVRKPIAPWAWGLSFRRGITVISPGDILSAGTAVFVNSGLADELIDAPPTVKTRQLLVVERPGNSSYSAPRPERFAALFGVQPAFLSWEQAAIRVGAALSAPAT